MKNGFYIRKINKDSIEETIRGIGFDKDYVRYALNKYRFILLKIHNLTCPQANIIKQVALSVGADAAVHREVITCKVEKTDLLLGVTYSQLEVIAGKLEQQPFKLSEVSKLLLEQIQNRLTPIKIRDTIFDWSKKTYIMGILNVTPDSFSDGGKFFSLDAAVEHGREMFLEGADIIDVGGESTKPGAREVSVEEELARVIPVIKKIREVDLSIPISIDTRHAEVAKEAVANGADIVNDVSGFDLDPAMISTVAKLNVPIIIMHSLGEPETMQLNPSYDENVIDAIAKNLYDKAQKATEAGIKPENIIIDPGIGFGKKFEHNLEIIRRIEEFTSLGYPLLVGISRKSVISQILNMPPSEREEANIALNSYLASNGVNIIRVHNVGGHVKALKVLDRVVKDFN